jgi:hypothetical protein
MNLFGFHDNIKKEIDLSDDGKDSTMDLAGFNDGKVAVTIEIKSATGGSVDMWWE